MRLANLTLFSISGKKLCGREVGELSLLGLIYKKRKTQRADRVQWPSFLQAGRPVSSCHIGLSTATDFRAERAVCWVGGQMEGGCTAQLSSASFPSAGTRPHPSSLPVPCSFIYSFSQSFLSMLSYSPSVARHFTVGYYFSMAPLYRID